MRRGDWKLITFEAEKRPPELYDLRRDPYEQTNVAAENPETVQSLRRATGQWWDAG